MLSKDKDYDSSGVSEVGPQPRVGSTSEVASVSDYNRGAPDANARPTVTSVEAAQGCPLSRDSQRQLGQVRCRIQ